MAFLAAAVPMVIGALAPAGAAAGAGASGLSLAATALSTTGTAVSAIAEQRAASYNAKVNDIQAGQAIEQAGLKSSEIARRNTQEAAAGRAGAAQNGFENTGSINDLLQQTARGGELDRLAAVYDGSVQAASLRADAKMNRQRGKQALVGGVIGAGAKALGGVSNFYDQRSRALSV